MSDLAFDVIVIGGGIVGCTSAYYLARRGLRVAVVERGRLAGGTTSKSFAWINGTSKTAAEDYHRLNAFGLRSYNELAETFDEAALGINRVGALKVVRKTDAAGYAAARQQARVLQDYGYAVGWLDRQALAAAEPHLLLPDDGEALHTMADLCLDAPRFTGFMAQQLCALGGAVFQDCAARALLADAEGQVRGLQTDAGEMKTTKLLLAAGPATADLLSALTGYDGFAARFPLRRVPGLLLTTPDIGPGAGPRRYLRHVVYFATGQNQDLHLLPDFDGGVKIGADDTDGMVDADATPEQLRAAAALLLARAQQRLPLLSGVALDACKLTLGIRPYPTDGRSLAGPLPGAKGLYLIATHSGITLAPALGRLMAELIASGPDGRVPEQLKPFGLERIKGLS